MFCLPFALVGISIAAASLVNSRLIPRFGTATVLRAASLFLAGFAVLFAVTSVLTFPSLLVLQIFVLILMFCKGIVFANCNALAMESQGPIAGFASGMVGALTMIASAVVAQLLGGLFVYGLGQVATGYAAVCSAAAYATWHANWKS